MAGRAKRNRAAPAGRVRPVVECNGREVLVLDRYTPFLLNAVSNAWQRKTAAIYRAHFDLGIVEWRVMGVINLEPGITATRLCELIRMDKAAVSRCLRQLEASDHVRFESLPSDPRKRRWWLSKAGQRIHDKMQVIALACEDEMLEGISAEELEVYVRVMHRMLSNVEG